ncbi:hypothetical protein [Bacillus sp. MRMR6]|uniref:hypothetical protein n=1 Tax=Bacillus sp. MRMR6 TaxID=1928617 RepID=UPI0011153320|nr:hypothetical protein [Bacillus sp. MRMR6]
MNWTLSIKRVNNNAAPKIQRTTVPIYKVPSYTKAAADEFVGGFFRKKNVGISNMEMTILIPGMLKGS